ncbi:MAG: DUF1648 domain-containing protein [Bacteroidota bacterium]
MEARPKIKLTLSPLDNALELTGKIFLLVLWGLIAYTYFKLPATIPIHFNASGQADGYGNKATLLLLPALATLLYVGLTQLNKYPHIFNYMGNITEDNALRQYTIATRMLRFIKVAILLIFSLVILFVYLTINGVTKGLGSWFLPFTLTLFLVPVIITISQSLKKKNNSA